MSGLWQHPLGTCLKKVATPIIPGTQLGRYEIRSQLGAGGMGEVYLAFDTELDRTVAIDSSRSLRLKPATIAAIRSGSKSRFRFESPAHPHNL